MTSNVTTIFNGQLQPTGTNTDRFKTGDYAVILTPTLQDDISIDAFLQLEFGNQNRLIPLSPVNVLDTNFITLIPRQFTVGNDNNLYLFIVPSEPINAEIIVVNNTDDKLDEIINKLNKEVAENVLNQVTDIIRVLGGDVSAVLPLLNNVASSLDSLSGVDISPLPPSVDTISELEAFY